MKAVQAWREDPEVREAARRAVVAQTAQAVQVVLLLQRATEIMMDMMSGPLGRHDMNTLSEAATRTIGARRHMDYLAQRTEPNETSIGNIAAFNGDRLCPEKGWDPPPPSDID